MKFIIISFLFVTVNLCAQEESTSTPTGATSTNISSSDWHSDNAINGTVSISKKANEPQVIHNRAELENEILRIDSHIESINSKVTSVNADPSEQAIANESGWFEDMEAIKIGLNNRKLEIQNSLINN
jgi:hypothetical protein